jgi:hypothetical protein
MMANAEENHIEMEEPASGVLIQEGQKERESPERPNEPPMEQQRPPV